VREELTQQRSRQVLVARVIRHCGG